jgi:hypothetical protein
VYILNFLPNLLIRSYEPISLLNHLVPPFDHYFLRGLGFIVILEIDGFGVEALEFELVFLHDPQAIVLMC